jgi:Cft2 family RNA processing exonuclease
MESFSHNSTEAIVKTAVAAGSKILVPVFAIDRTQRILYLLADMFRQSPFQSS